MPTIYNDVALDYEEPFSRKLIESSQRSRVEYFQEWLHDDGKAEALIVNPDRQPLPSLLLLRRFHLSFLQACPPLFSFSFSGAVALSFRLYDCSNAYTTLHLFLC